MYFQLRVTEPPADPHLSWILSKHPERRFWRDLANQPGVRVVAAQFQPDGSYVGEVVNDSVGFLSTLREHNAANYVDISLHAVCPMNLKGLSVALRSALYGKRDANSELTEEQFSAPKRLSLEIGPFPRGRERAVAIFAEAGLSAEVLDEGTRSAFTLRVSNPDPLAPLSVTSFLQRVYLLSHYLTQRVGYAREINDAQIDKFVGLCAGWLPTMPSSADVVRELCGFRRGIIGEFESRLDAAQVDDLAADDLPSDEGPMDEAAGAPTRDNLEERSVSTVTAAADEGERALERRLSLHERRHALILTAIEEDLHSREESRRSRGDLTAGEMASLVAAIGPGHEAARVALKVGGQAAESPPPYRVIDLGCGGGELSLRILERFAQANVLAIDADLRCVTKARRRMWRGLPRRGRDDGEIPSRVHVVHANLTYPELRDADLRPDALVLSEVIEHLETADRRRLLTLVAEVVCPRLLILTTPNVEYNPRLGIPDGEYRHADHRVEYTCLQFQDEVVSLLSPCYDVELRDVVEGDLQPSFVLVARRRLGAPDSRGLGRANRLYAPFHLDATNYDVTGKELRLGATSYPFLRNARDIFYLGPTISPVDYDARHPDHLEHPESCFAYYRARGVDRIVGEQKYMGSRAYVLALRDPDMAGRLGVSGPLVVNARGGLPFFGRADRASALAQIYGDLRPRMEDLGVDLLILDAEILPWSVKAEQMIEKLFLLPGETALLARRRPGSTWASLLSNAEKFLGVLGEFSEPGPLEVRPFHVLARANFSSRGVPSRDLRIGFHVSHREQLDVIEGLANGVVKPCSWHDVDLTSRASTDRSVDLWSEHCACSGEGFVYKPAEKMSLRGPDGYLRQPALKVRGREYLRLIYGIDYLESSWFDRLRVRNTRRKRVLAVQEQELAERLLLAFLHQNETARLSYLAAFLGVDGVRMPEIDRTL